MNPILIVALTLFAASLPVIAFVVIHTRRITRLHALALAEQQRAARDQLDTVHLEHRQEYVALHRDTQGKIEQLRASNLRLVKSNQDLKTELADTRIQAIPLHNDPFTLADRQVLMTASTQLMILKGLCVANPALAPLLSPSNVQRVLDELEKVLARVTRHLVADGTLQLQAPAKIDRSANGYWSHPYLPLFHQDLTWESQDAWLKAQQLEARLVWDERFEENPDVDPYGSLSTFEPTPPDGDGWFLLSIDQNDDGEARAWYARRIVETPDTTTEAAA